MHTTNSLLRLRGASLAAVAGLTLLGGLLMAQPAAAATNNSAQSAAQSAAQVYQEGRTFDGDRTITGSSFELRSGERMRGNLTVLGGEVTLEEGSHLDGSLIVLGGSADVAGDISGDINVLGGSVDLQSGASVNGEVSSLGGDIQQSNGARVNHVDDVAAAPAIRDTVRDHAPWRNNGPFNRMFRWWEDGSDNIGGVILITLFAIVVAHFLPKQLGQGVSTVRGNALQSFGVGLLGLIAVIVTSVVMSFTIIMIPGAIVLMIAAVLAMLAGWVAIARMIGARLMQGFNKTDWTLVGQVAAGSVVLAVLGMLPIVGDWIGWGAMLTGFGALLLTRGGTQVYPPSNSNMGLQIVPPTDSTPVSV